jgi:hypothetical protein
MEVLELIHAKLALAHRVLKDLIAHYEGMEDATRVEKSNTILDELNSYLQIEENLLFPFIRRTGEHEDLIERAKTVHQQIDYVTEHMVMMHVDEPGGDFYNRLLTLDNLLAEAERIDREVLFPWAKAYLSEADQDYIANHLKDQMTHESIPPSGMTIY